ncbi:MAG: N-acetylmuramoyl-L-alanine amidase [Actinobacteria bacterium]|nr:N-acetylmuramoyl-L-alanine amidase [Actinomycetota bacterium]
MLDGTAKRLHGAVAHAGSGTALLGDVRSRADWGADESIREGKPEYASGVDAVVVHHTAQGNDYREADVPALIRADYAYHVKGRGWSDLGYNLLVDRFGHIWEGRAGGIGRATIGAHAQGFNTRTVGVSLIGDMTQGQPPAAAVKAMARVAAYAAATWRFDPTSSAVLTSRGSPRYPSGRKVELHRVFGHLETGQTSCPGSLQNRLPDIRKGAAALLGPAPRIDDVTVSGAPVHAPVPLTVQATLSREAPWTASVRDEDGRLVKTASGESTLASIEWNGLVGLTDSDPAVLPAREGTYTWSVQVDDGYHRAVRRTGTVLVGLPVVPSG